MEPSTSAPAWRDSKRYLWVFGLAMPLLPFLAVVGHQVSGWGVWLWLGPIVILGIATSRASGLPGLLCRGEANVEQLHLPPHFVR